MLKFSSRSLGLFYIIILSICHVHAFLYLFKHTNFIHNILKTLSTIFYHIYHFLVRFCWLIFIQLLVIISCSFACLISFLWKQDILHFTFLGSRFYSSPLNVGELCSRTQSISNQIDSLSLAFQFCIVWVLQSH